MEIEEEHSRPSIPGAPGTWQGRVALLADREIGRGIELRFRPDHDGFRLDVPLRARAKDQDAVFSGCVSDPPIERTAFAFPLALGEYARIVFANKFPA